MPLTLVLSEYIRHRIYESKDLVSENNRNKKEVSLHSLSHSFATHLPREIQS